MSDSEQQRLRGLNPESRGVGERLGATAPDPVDTAMESVGSAKKVVSAAKVAKEVAQQAGMKILPVVTQGLKFLGWVFVASQLVAPFVQSILRALTYGDRKAFSEGVAIGLTFAAYGAPLDEIVPHSGYTLEESRASFRQGVAKAHALLEEIANESRPVPYDRYYERIYRAVCGRLEAGEEATAKRDPAYFLALVHRFEAANNVKLVD